MVVMRFLADGKIRWCFFPPSTAADRTGKGIWLGGSEEGSPEDSDGATTAIEDEISDNTDDGSDLEVMGTNKSKSVKFEVEESGSDDDGEEEDSDEEAEAGGAGGFFAALQLEDQSDTDDDNDDGDDDGSEEGPDPVDDDK